MNRLTQTMKKRKGFTLVELIVVIVIILILAAVMVPLLMNYIGQAKMAKNIEEAKTCMTVTQGEMINLYAENTIISNTTLQYGDVDLRNTPTANNILNSLGAKPYMLILGMGDYKTYSKENKMEKAYTVYFAAYWANKDDDPIFNDGTDWTTKYPWTGDGKNTFNVHGDEVNLQFYFITAPNSNISTNWGDLQKKVGVK